jgi:putative protease
MRVPRILSPVRSYEGGVRIIEAGADEVYCGVTIPGIKDFTLYRGPSCEVPTYSELGQLVKYAHSRDVKVVVVVNRPFMAEVIEKAIRKHIHSCVEEGIDALIIGDIGTLSIIKDMGLEIPLYASTYTVSMNYGAVDFLSKLGFTRVILDRQLTIGEISEIVQRSKVEIEIFVHGGGCSNINGSCYLYHFRFPARTRAIEMIGGLVKSPCALPFDIYARAPCNQTKTRSYPDRFWNRSKCLFQKTIVCSSQLSVDSCSSLI